MDATCSCPFEQERAGPVRCVRLVREADALARAGRRLAFELSGFLDANLAGEIADPQDPERIGWDQASIRRQWTTT